MPNEASITLPVVGQAAAPYALAGPDPAQLPGAGAGTRPVMVFDVHYACNQTCSYCVSGSTPQNDFGAMGDPQKVEQMLAFFAKHGPFTVLFTGGEPLVTPGIDTFFCRLIELGHDIILQSNLKSGASKFMTAVPTASCKYVLSAFHSVELLRWPRYLETVLKVRDTGYPLAVKLVLDEPMLPHWVGLYETLKSHGIGVLLSPLIEFPRNADAVAKTYTLEQWRDIAPRIATRSTWLYFASGFHSKGTPCRAGSAVLHAQTVQRGHFGGCAHGFPARIGNIFEGRLERAPQLVSCGLTRCVCDFHTYQDFVPGLEDSERFMRLTRGDNTPMPFADYLAWIEAARIRPVTDLRPIAAALGLLGDSGGAAAGGAGA